MKVVKLGADNHIEVIAEAVEVLRRGGSIVYPTDTVYGLGVNPFDDYAVRRLFRIKKRSPSKPIALIVCSIAMVKKLAHVSVKEEKILKSLWPGAVSVVLYKKKLISPLISAGTDTVSLRMPDNEFCLKLIKAFNGPITSTSANISDEQYINDASEIARRFKKEAYKPDLVVDAGVLALSEPSTVLDLTKPKPKIIRAGPVNAKDLENILLDKLEIR